MGRVVELCVLRVCGARGMVFERVREGGGKGVGRTG